MKLAIVFGHHDLVALNTMVIVETWNQVMNSGRGQRKYKAEFSKSEREAARALHRMYYRWNMTTGFPQEFLMTIWSYRLTQKMCNFFGAY
jgi:hypothetical protein